MFSDCRQANKIDYFLSLIIFLVFTTIGITTIHEYGLTWDEPENLVVGERYLAFFKTLDISFLDMRRAQPEVDNPDGLHLRLYDSHAHPPLPNIAAALTGRLFGRWTKLLDPVDARHVAILMMGGLVLAVTYLFAREAFSRSTAIFAVLVLVLLPRFFAHTHFNLNDIPKTLFFALTLWGLWRGIIFKKSGSIYWAGLAAGAGISVRPNVLLAILAGSIWLIFVKDRWVSEKKTGIALLLFPLLICAGFIASWPAMWVMPVRVINDLVEYWTWLGISPRENWTPYPLLMLAFTTPLSTLFLLYWGIIASIRLRKIDENFSVLLIWLWLVFPVLRVAIPGMNVYDGVRHFLEVLPALAILSALGAEELIWLVSRIIPKFPNRIMRLATYILLIPALLELLRFAPYEIAYFNRIIGGLKGAQSIGIREATDYWGSSYRKGFAWLNENTPEDTCLYVPVGQAHIARAVQGLWLREDICIVKPGDEVRGLVFVMHTTRPSEYVQVDLYAREKFDPVYFIQRDSAVILEIFKLSKGEWEKAINWGQ